MNFSGTLKTSFIITTNTSESPESTGSKRNIGQVTTAQVTSNKCTRNILCRRGLTAQAKVNYSDFIVQPQSYVVYSLVVSFEIKLHVYRHENTAEVGPSMPIGSPHFLLGRFCYTLPKNPPRILSILVDDS